MERHEMASSADQEESWDRVICHVSGIIAQNNSRAVGLFGLFGLGCLKNDAVRVFFDGITEFSELTEWGSGGGGSFFANLSLKIFRLSHRNREARSGLVRGGLHLSKGPKLLSLLVWLSHGNSGSEELYGDLCEIRSMSLR
jgi:hypothetical protein